MQLAEVIETLIPSISALRVRDGCSERSEHGPAPAPDPGLGRGDCTFTVPLRLLFGLFALPFKNPYGCCGVTWEVIDLSSPSQISAVGMECHVLDIVPTASITTPCTRVCIAEPCFTDQFGVARTQIEQPVCMICMDTPYVLRIEVEDSFLAVHLHQRGEYTIGLFSDADTLTWDQFYTERKTYARSDPVTWIFHTSCPSNHRLHVTYMNFNFHRSREGMTGFGLSS